MMLCTVEVDKQKMGPSGRLMSQRGWHASGWNLGYPHCVACALSSEPKLEATHIVVQKIILKGEFKWTMGFCKVAITTTRGEGWHLLHTVSSLPAAATVWFPQPPVPKGGNRDRATAIHDRISVW